MKRMQCDKISDKGINRFIISVSLINKLKLMIDKKSSKAKHSIAANVWNLESSRMLAMGALFPTMPTHVTITDMKNKNISRFSSMI